MVAIPLLSAGCAFPSRRGTSKTNSRRPSPRNNLLELFGGDAWRNSRVTWLAEKGLIVWVALDRLNLMPTCCPSFIRSSGLSIHFCDFVENSELQTTPRYCYWEREIEPVLNMGRSSSIFKDSLAGASSFRTISRSLCHVYLGFLFFVTIALYPKLPTYLLLPSSIRGKSKVIFHRYFRSPLSGSSIAANIPRNEP